MGLFNNYQKEGKGVSKEDNTPRLFLFFQIYFRRFWNLISINLLYILFCIPIITIGPATAGLTKVVRNYARSEHAFIWGDFIEAFKKNFKQSLIYSIIDFLVVAFFVLDFYSLYNVPNAILRTVSLAAILFSFTVWHFMRYYIYNMMVTFRLTFKQLVKNAFIFCWVGFIRNLFTTVVLALVTLLIVYGVKNLIFIFFIVCTLYFSFWHFLVNFMVNPLIKKHMMDGYDPETGKKLEEEKYEGFEETYERDELDDEESES